MQRSMAAEAEATREARAKVIAAEGEQKASRQLKEAADIIVESPAALQLRYLQTLTQISAEKNSTIVFPIPSIDSILFLHIKYYHLFSRTTQFNKKLSPLNMISFNAAKKENGTTLSLVFSFISLFCCCVISSLYL